VGGRTIRPRKPWSRENARYFAPEALLADVVSRVVYVVYGFRVGDEEAITLSEIGGGACGERENLLRGYLVYGRRVRSALAT
jgi:hypothetical protein